MAIKALNLGADGYYNKQGNPETVYGELAHGIKLSVKRKKAEEIVRKSEARYRELANFLPEIVFETDSSGKITFFSQNAFEITGYTHEELEKGMNMLQFVVPEDRERAKENIRRRMTGEKTDNSEYTLFRKNGDTYPAIVKTAPIFSENKLIGLRGLVIDITQRNKAQLELKHYNQVLEKVGEGIDVGLAVVNRDYRVVWANKHLMDLGVATNSKCYETFNNLGVVCPDCGVEQIFQRNVSLDVREYETSNSEGETVWTELRVTPLKDKDGNVIAALVLAVPINERKSKEAQIVFQSKLLESVGESIIATDRQGKIVFWNEAASRTYGWDSKEVLGRNIADVIVPKIMQEDGVKILEKLVQGKSWSGEFQVQRRDGNVFPVLVTYSPVLDDKGELLGIIGVSIDLSETKNLEKELSNLAKFPSENPNAVVRVNENGIVLHANPVAQSLPLSVKLKTGYHVSEKWRKLVVQALSSGCQLDFEEEVKGRSFSFCFSPIVSEGYVNIYGLDITERKKAERALQKALEETTMREREVSALLDSTKSILKNDEFSIVAREIFDDCKNMIGATAGYVALLSDDGSENKVLFLDAGGLSCTVNPSLPMPIRGLRENAYRTCEVVYENDFSKSNWIRFMPKGHVNLRNVLFVPLVVDGKAVGLMGLANKPSDFTDRDALIGSGFGEYAALALNNSWKMTSLGNQRKNV